MSLLTPKAARKRFRRLLTKKIPVWLVAGQCNFDGPLTVKRYYNRFAAVEGRRVMKASEFYRVGKVWKTRVPLE